VFVLEEEGDDEGGESNALVRRKQIWEQVEEG
jgi:hypothetical protein